MCFVPHVLARMLSAAIDFHSCGRAHRSKGQRLLLYGVCCMLRVVCCMLYVVCCVFPVACCLLRVACIMLAGLDQPRCCVLRTVCAIAAEHRPGARGRAALHDSTQSTFMYPAVPKVPSCTLQYPECLRAPLPHPDLRRAAAHCGVAPPIRDGFGRALTCGMRHAT